MEDAKELLASFAADPSRRVALLFERAQLEEGRESRTNRARDQAPSGRAHL